MAIALISKIDNLSFSRNTCIMFCKESEFILPKMMLQLNPKAGNFVGKEDSREVLSAVAGLGVVVLPEKRLDCTILLIQYFNEKVIPSEKT